MAETIILALSLPWWNFVTSLLPRKSEALNLGRSRSTQEKRRPTEQQIRNLNLFRLIIKQFPILAADQATFDQCARPNEDLYPFEVKPVP
jgi:hypothetical protein